MCFQTGITYSNIGVYNKAWLKTNNVYIHYSKGYRWAIKDKTCLLFYCLQWNFCFFEKSVRMIYFLVIKHLNMSANFKIGFYVYTEKKYTCVIKRYEYMLHFAVRSICLLYPTNITFCTRFDMMTRKIHLYRLVGSLL